MRPRPDLDLATRQIPLSLLDRGDRLVRVHSLGRDPLFFGPAVGTPPTGRRDSPDGRFRTCYFAEAAQPHIAFAERFLRDPERTLIPEAELLRAAVSVVQVRTPVAIVPFHGSALRRIGATATIAHGDHRESRQWASALYHHPTAPGGVRWRSRIDDDGFAIALFERARRALKVVETRALLGGHATFDLEAWLDRYGAAIVEDHDRG